MSKEIMPFNRDIQKQADDVVQDHFMETMIHGAGCGCNGCMANARNMLDWYLPNDMDMHEKNETIKAFVADLKGETVLIDFSELQVQRPMITEDFVEEDDGA